MKGTVGQFLRAVLGGDELEPELRDYYAAQRKANRRPVLIPIRTKVPDKWRFVDLETNQVWAWDQAEHEFVEATDLELRMEEK